jgi:hypothetical protein
LQIVKMLLKKGAAASLLNEKKLSPLDVATPSVQSYLKGLFLCSRARYDIWLILKALATRATLDSESVQAHV